MIKRIVGEAPKEQPEITFLPSEKPRWGERLARNLALAGMLLLTVTALRNAELPAGDTVLSAVQRMIGGEWDESLGQISFVGNFLPETVAVFFESAPEAALTAPCFGEISHAWSAGEPYLGYTGTDLRVFAAAAGQVMSVAHGPEEEVILRLRHEDGLETLYYGLASAAVREGDAVTAGDCLGLSLGPGPLLEVRRAGRAIDPTGLIAPREGSAP